MRFLIPALSAFALTACGQAEPISTVSNVEIEQVKLLPCPDPDVGRACAYDHESVPGYFEAALEGDYQAQRNLSYAFTQTSDWLVQRPIQGCAWRMVILATRPPDAVYDDAGMYRIQCDSLSERDLADAKTLANVIHRRIHGADLPELPPVNQG